MPEGVEEGIIQGYVSARAQRRSKQQRVQLMGAGAILREVEAAAEILSGLRCCADVWSLTS